MTLISNNTRNTINKQSTIALPSFDVSSFVYNNLPIRKRLQKIEFFMGWVIIFLTVVSTLASSNVNVQQTQFFLALQSAAILYFRLSLITRSFAYAVDLSNAFVRFDGVIPAWLILHHSGVWVQHLVKTFFLAPQSPMHIIIYSLGFQSTHNTWTKKYSLALYWGNVLVGVMACIHCIFIQHDADAFASRCFNSSFRVTSAGIILLFLDSHVSSKTRENIQYKMMQKIALLQKKWSTAHC